MQREYPKQPLVGVGAIIVDDGRVLLIKRGKAPLLGEWSIPGGMLELGETLRQGAEREAREETGLVVRASDLLGVFDRIVPASQVSGSAGTGPLYHYVLVDFLCKKISGEAIASGDASDVQWFSRAQLRALALPSDTEEVLQMAIEKSK